MGFSPGRAEDIRTALGEAVTNAIEHGNRGDVSKRVRVDFTALADSLTIEVADESTTPFPSGILTRVPASIGDRLEGKAPNRGWGTFLIQALVDRLEFVSTGSGNIVRMVVQLEPTQRAAPLRNLPNG
jgi:serine/threonine-protein kinase RsbW